MAFNLAWFYKDKETDKENHDVNYISFDYVPISGLSWEY